VMGILELGEPDTRGPGQAGSVRASLPRPLRLAALACTLALLAVSAAPASAAVTHLYLSGPSGELAKGVPKGCGVEPPEAEPPCVSGPLNTVYGMTVDGKSVWALDYANREARIDRFNDETGAFTGPQVDEEGEAAGLLQPLGVGHAFGGGQVYAQDAQDHGSVAVFDSASGKLDGVWSGAHTANGGFQGELLGVAVDSSLSDLNSGDVFVAAPSFRGEPSRPVVDVFNPEKAAKAGEEPLEVATELAGTCASAKEVLPCAGSSLIPFHIPGPVAVSPLNGDVLVAARAASGQEEGVVDVFEPASGMVGVYAFAFAITEAAPGSRLGGIGALAADADGDIYVGNGGVVDQFNSEGVYLGRMTGTPAGPFGRVTSLAVDPESHRVFVGQEGAPLAVFGEGITIPDVRVTKTEAGEVHARSATLHGTVKLDKAGSASCVLDYGTSSSYGSETPCEPASATEAEEQEGNPVPVKQTIEGLEPDTTYFYRVVATNSSGIAASGEGAEDQGQIKTTGPGKHGEAAAEVSSTAATLQATIDPDGSPTSYYIQYNAASTETCEATVTSSSCPTLPAPPGEALGSAAGDQNVSQRAQSLSPGTEYHYRVVVVSEPKHGQTEVFPEEDKTFTTQPPATQLALPDGRQWELVSPPDKHGALVLPLQGSSITGGYLTESSLSGATFTYVTNIPTEEKAPGYHWNEQIMATRGAAGWSSQDISLPHAIPDAPANGEEYRFFTEDLSLAVAEPLDEFTSLNPDAFPADTERTPFVRHNLTCQTTPSTCFQPLVTGAPGYADVPEGTKFGPEELPDVRFVGASPDLMHVLVRSGVALKAGVPGDGLYEWSAGKPPSEELQTVSVLPEGEGGAPVTGELAENALGSFAGTNARWAVSADGSRVVWVVVGAQGLYLRENATQQSATSGGGCTEPAKACSIRLDVPEAQCVAKKECAGEDEALFQLADREDSRVLFSDGRQLLKGAGRGALYECEVVVEASGHGCVLRDVVPGADVVGDVLGASEDASYLYFVSGSVVGDAAEHRVSPGDNLYMVHYDSATHSWGAPVFIAALSGNDGPDWNTKLSGQTARVSPNGRWLAFMSDRSLTGYDNRDARSGKPDEEVFLYDAADGRLACVSCNPTGARPDGIERGGGISLATGFDVWEPMAWLAANIPGWTPFGSFTARYQSRFLSDEGRLFFNSSDSLVPQDINANEDVYEFEPAGVGGCSSSTSGFNAAIGGCVALISSGTSPEESAFLDASEHGEDVFFMTAEKLVSQDTDTAFDVYDAHVCSTASPCVSAPVSSSACVTADACWAAPFVQPSVFGAPASATFSGPGNPAAPAPSGTAAPSRTCKRGFVKNGNGKCVRKRHKKRKAKKASRARNDRRGM
jgi:hypothetical protein